MEMIKRVKNNRLLKKVSIILGLFCIASLGCKKDEQIPTINYFNLNNSSDTLRIPFDETLKISFEAIDNENLDGYRISLYNNFAFSTLTKANTTLNDIRVGNFLNPLKDSVIINKVLLDSNVAGPYFATLEVNDLEGNRTDLIFRNFVLTRPDAPVIELSNIDFNHPLKFLIQIVYLLKERCMTM